MSCLRVLTAVVSFSHSVHSIWLVGSSAVDCALAGLLIFHLRGSCMVSWCTWSSNDRLRFSLNIGTRRHSWVCLNSNITWSLLDYLDAIISLVNRLSSVALQSGAYTSLVALVAMSFFIAVGGQLILPMATILKKQHRTLLYVSLSSPSSRVKLTEANGSLNSVKWCEKCFSPWHFSSLQGSCDWIWPDPWTWVTCLVHCCAYSSFYQVSTHWRCYTTYSYGIQYGMGPGQEVVQEEEKRSLWTV
jgi:hypothetical protein